MNALKMWHTKNAPVASIRQGKRFAERWCATRLYPDLPLREAVVLLTDNTPIKPARPLPGLPPTRAQQLQAQRLDEAAVTAAARIREALGPIRPPSGHEAPGQGFGEGPGKGRAQGPAAHRLRLQATRSCTTLPSRSRSR